MSRSRRTDLVVLLAYVAVACAYFGWPLLPHPGRPLLGVAGDPPIFVWSLEWWPHAIGSGRNPFESDALYHPGGFNTMWATTVPGLALAFAPVTLLAGPAVAYNLAALLAPALAAFTAYLLCRYATGSLWGSIAGGYVFGFSAFVLTQLNEGRLHIEAAFLLPLVALVVLRFLRGDLDGRGLAWRLGVLLALQLAIATEVAVSLTLALVLALALAHVLVPSVRARVRAAAVPVAAGYLLAGVLAAPFLAWALRAGIPDAFTGAERSRSDVLNFLLPTRLFALGGSSLEDVTTRFPREGQESGAYLGIPLLVVLGLLALRWRRDAAARFLLVAAAVAAVIALGDGVHVLGRSLVPTPWALVDGLPVLDNVKPSRFTAYLALSAAAGLALWIGSTRGRVYARPYVLPVLAVVALVPAAWEPLYHHEPERVAFFADGHDARCIPHGENVAVFPLAVIGRFPLLWQAESGFRWDTPGGAIGPDIHGVEPLSPPESDPVAWELNYLYRIARPTMERLLGWAAEHEVDRIVAVESEGWPSAVELGRIGPVSRMAGVLVAPGCGEPPLDPRELAPYLEAYREQVRTGATIGWCHGRNYTLLPVGVEPAAALEGATPARFVEGRGLTCEPPPPGFVRRGLAPAEYGVPPDTYPLFAAPPG